MLKTRTATNAMKTKMTILALLVAATPQTKAAIHRTFKPNDFEVLWASSPSEAIEASARQRADLLLLDVNEPPSSGRRTFEDLRALNPGAPVVILAENETSSGLTGEGAATVVMKKPVGADSLAAIVQALLKTPTAIVPDANQGSKLPDALAASEDFRASLQRRATAPFVSAIPYHRWGINE